MIFYQLIRKEKFFNSAGEKTPAVLDYLRAVELTANGSLSPKNSRKTSNGERKQW